MGITELAELVRAGLAEDEEAAKHATAGPWWTEDTSPVQWGQELDAKVASADGTLAVLCPEWNGPLNADHITRHNPHRVLAEVAAKRQLLDTVLAWPHDRHSDDDWYSCSQAREAGEYVCSNESREGEPCDCGRDERVLAVLQTLATPYQETT